MVQLFVRHKVDVSSTDRDGNNAVNGLCLNYFQDNLTDVIQVLLEAGTDINCRNNSGINALLYLCKKQKGQLIEKIQFLMDKGIDVHCKDNDRANVLHYLCRYYPKDDLCEIVKYLIKKREVDKEFHDSDGWLALHYLCRYYNGGNMLQIIQLFKPRGPISNGIDCRSLVRDNYKNGNVVEILQYFES
jgi:ankyrin repeat protein